jgi:hypothetical protein
MRLCGRCKLPPRVDDSLQRTQWQGDDGATVTTNVCRQCEYTLRGQEPPPDDPVYVPGNYGPPLAGRVCGLCFRAMREDNMGEQMRIQEADIEPGERDGLGDDLLAGSRWCCIECIERFRPRIAARMGKPVESVHGNWLL